MQNVIQIDGKEYPTESFDDTQKYIVTQIRNLQAKQLQAKMELDQVQIALTVYTNQLIASVKQEENSDSSNESADVKAMVAQFHTDEVKKAFAEHLKNSTP